MNTSYNNYTHVDIEYKPISKASTDHIDNVPTYNINKNGIKKK